MPADTAAPATRTSSASTRERILDAASEQFYAHGIRATSADRIIEQVGITKVTFYRHFRSKSDLVVAYLEQQAAGERDWMQSIRREDDPAGSLQALADGIGSASCRPGFRGCAFINAAAEFADPADPVRTAVETHRRWVLDHFAAIAHVAGVEDSGSAAQQLMMLRDGAMVSGYLGEASSVAASLGEAFASVLALKGH
ncbi:TetR/AcrR family transcriptional regulator [Rhodococcoides kyotonense]|uniref:DNA-binding transcriptional regulator, AcrR family n=1 Tax=Rhodococcoides kyotonense TaxID=398843 RepID=A0A239JZT1_9NOCA|nr:TetR/AcrR family transcriptional regulator [Rhodococcus kyotonensis]SNT10294.1 DNA-binding transcriptional regulator, AcrR family [Rhodococcus kyotonensis]